MATPSDTMRLEGFSEPLKGRMIYVVATSPEHQKQLLTTRVAILETELAHRGRKIMVWQGPSNPPKWFLLRGGDAFFHVRDANDLRLALTFIQYAAKPARVIWGGSEPAANVLGALGKIDNATVVGFGATIPYSADWNAIFWHTSAPLESVEPGVLARLGSSGSLRSVLKELQASEVALVWSNINETNKQGSLYWYDPSEGLSTASILDRHESVELLRIVADSLSHTA
jgi:hypothetical protein